MKFRSEEKLVGTIGLIGRSKNGGEREREKGLFFFPYRYKHTYEIRGILYNNQLTNGSHDEQQ
jgi:hypothetical protein